MSSCRLNRSSQLALPGPLQSEEAVNSKHTDTHRDSQQFGGSLHAKRSCYNVWTSVLHDVEFTEMTEFIKVAKVRIVAWDGKNTGSSVTE
ncbi:Transcription initiation factor IIA subunit 2 [Manis javanica]|nr:Transcription initiation factor IIA subunit 2 [Manis javanica]